MIIDIDADETSPHVGFCQESQYTSARYAKTNLLARSGPWRYSYIINLPPHSRRHPETPTTLPLRCTLLLTEASNVQRPTSRT